MSKSIENHRKDEKTAEKLGETEQQRKPANSSNLMPTPQEGEQRLKTRSYTKPSGPGNIMAFSIAR
jgi:hypothetical protein